MCENVHTHKENWEKNEKGHIHTAIEKLTHTHTTTREKRKFYTYIIYTLTLYRFDAL